MASALNFLPQCSGYGVMSVLSEPQHCIPQVSTLPFYVIVLPLACILVARCVRDLVNDIAHHRSDALVNNKPCEILRGQSKGSVTGSFDTCILVARCVRDLVNDIAHHRSDALVNNKPCEILRGQRFNTEKWKDINIGDIICMRKNDFVPADTILLHSTEPNGLCYVETAGIDGETNLKIRQSLMVTQHALNCEKALAEFDGLVTCEEPNIRLHKFVGILEWDGKTYALNNENILLRDCKVRNIDHCYGLVIYAGPESKIMMNSGKVTIKRSLLEYLINKNVVSIAAMIIITSTCLGIIAGFWIERNLKKHYYIPSNPQMSSSLMGLFTAWSYFVATSTLVPFFLYIGLELIFVTCNVFIDNDLEMYYAESDIPAQARASRLNDLLGQVQYVFTDKTGTLTQNVMTFKKCSIGQRMFGTTSGTEKGFKVDFDWNKYADPRFQFYDQSLIDVVRKDEDVLVREFFRLIALCHTVMVDDHDDEEALVTAARNFGYVFLSRNLDSITISELGTIKTYSILALMDFNSERKRMSILVRDQEGKIKLYVKGADTVILKRLHPTCSSDSIMEALDHFSEETLRSLCMAYKEVEESVYNEWELKHEKASTSLNSRDKHLQEVYEEMEINLQLLGATAIEDKLQDGVPETIQFLREGGMKVWMLTGDKKETAVNIGYSCNLLTSDMRIFEYSDIRQKLDNILENNSNGHGKWRNVLNTDGTFGKSALVLTGEDLIDLLDSNEEDPKISLWEKLTLVMTRKAGKSHSNMKAKALVELSHQFQSVICSRVTPNQKAAIVQLVKEYMKVITLCIGDGGNDVNMIKTAHIGIGIYGKEGLQAVLASDYAIGQFSFLKRLLFLHGRLSYIRLSKYLCYYNYKTLASLVNNYWFGFFNGFSTLLTFESWYLVFNAILYTFFPAIYIAIMDKDVDNQTSLQRPELYKVGQQDRHRGLRVFLYCLYGIYTSIVMLFIPYGVFLDSAGPMGIFDYQVFACTTTTIGVLAILAEAAIQFSSWSVFAFISLGLSFGFYLLLSYVSGMPAAFLYSASDFNFLGAFVNTISSGYIWLLILLAVIVSIIPSLFFRPWAKFTASNLTTPAPKIKDSVVLRSVIRWRSGRRRSSYAFSQYEVLPSGPRPKETSCDKRIA
ncbi:phospholipid-transporting ATPase IK [Pelobates cultripes]|uniref:Phospholipid-transporting ATPase n=1 Tax=Pelobates cultripes TaxID=61616 RepID=A0AAD1W3N3_PELCU|nr:phospholipid-transporting ATPase IK [Pelobates cultripes]